MSIKQPFEKVVAEHGRTVLRVCRALLASQDADDAWSETFLSAMRGYPDLPATANVEAWLVTIAHRKAIDVLRSRNRQPVPVADVVGACPGPGHARRPRLRRRAVAGGPGAAGRQRQAVAYHYVAGLPYAEIAQIIGGSTDAARRAAADGIRNLRRNYPGGGPS